MSHDDHALVSHNSFTLTFMHIIELMSTIMGVQWNWQEYLYVMTKSPLL